MIKSRIALLFMFLALAVFACRPTGSAEATVAAPEPVAATPASGMELEGMFRYLADAALFRDCRTSRSYPVAMEGAYIELERAYLNSGITAGKEIHVQLRGRYLERPAMEGNINEIMLIVDLFNKLDLEKTCAPGGHAELLETYWKLTVLRGQPVRTPEGSSEAHLILSGSESRVRGNAGCNNFFGGFETEDDSLTFGALGATMKACPGGMDTEQAFLQALQQATRYVIEGEILQLYADDRPLARFEAMYL